MPMARNLTCGDGAKDAVPIADQVARSLNPGKRLSYMARDPFAVACIVTSIQIRCLRIQLDDDKGIEQLKLRVGTANKSIAAMSGA